MGNMKRYGALSVLLVASWFLTLCSSRPDMARTHDRIQDVYKEAQKMAEDGQTEEAVRLMEIVAELYPDDPRISEFRARLTEEQAEAIAGNKWLGFNKARRARVERTTAQKILWYLPDRLLDLTEVFNVSVSCCLQWGWEAWVTKAVQFTLYFRAAGAFGVGGPKKQLVWTEAVAASEFGMGPAVISAISKNKVGTGGFESTVRTLVLHTPDHPHYQEYGDYWSVGLGIYFVGGIRAEVHLLEIFDFFAGILTFDPLNDDFATSRRLRYDKYQRDAIRNLQEEISKFDDIDRKTFIRQYPTF